MNEALEQLSISDTAPSEQHSAPISKTIAYKPYESEEQLPVIIALIEKELSEPYVVYTYRYFLTDWPQLCFLAFDGDTAVGVIVCKQAVHRGHLNRGYIAMLSIKPDYRKLGIASKLVQMAIDAMIVDGAEEVILETEVDNESALRLYERLGFIREKRLHRFYLNGKDAFRLCLPLVSSFARPRRKPFDDMIDEEEPSEEDDYEALYS